jgi:hypothetical protein
LIFIEWREVFLILILEGERGVFFRKKIPLSHTLSPKNLIVEE